MLRSSWHQIAGRYDPVDRWVGMDYKTVFLDPTLADLVYFHENTHKLLCQTTEYGQAQATIVGLISEIKTLSNQETNEIEALFFHGQEFVQEGLATLMEILRLTHLQGPEQANKYAKETLPDSYYEKFKRLAFVLDMSEEQRNNFTKKLSNLAMNTSIRLDIANLDLLSSGHLIIEYLKEPENQPDNRFAILTELIKKDHSLILKDVNEICLAADLPLFPGTKKQEVADFVNYVLSFTEREEKIVAKSIGDPGDGPSMDEGMIVANMNFNLAGAKRVLQFDELDPYKDSIEAILVQIVPTSADYLPLEQLSGNKYEAGLVAFTRSGEKIIMGHEVEAITTYVNKELNNSTLIVKWGLFEPGLPRLKLFKGCRPPNAVIYNTVDEIDSIFGKWLRAGNEAEYLHIGVAENHPVQTLTLKDATGVVHLVNTFGNKAISSFLENNKDSLIEASPTDFLIDPRHYNNVMSVWMGLPWEIDWYQTMINGKKIILRPSK